MISKSHNQYLLVSYTLGLKKVSVALSAQFFFGGGRGVGSSIYTFFLPSHISETVKQAYDKG